MLTPEEFRAVALLAALVSLGTALTWLDARHPRFLTLTLGDSLALGATPFAPPETPEIAPPAASGPASDVAVRPATPAADPEKSAFGLDGRLDINRASADELEGLPGIGPKTALRILEDRRAHGRFRKISDLGRVKGIGPKTLDRLRPHVTVASFGDSARTRPTN